MVQPSPSERGIMGSSPFKSVSSGVIQNYKMTLPMLGITKIYRENRRRTVWCEPLSIEVPDAGFALRLGPI
ncbi:hypothetical protein thsrh120_63660 [Rhizobium sp. No.120]